MEDGLSDEEACQAVTAPQPSAQKVHRADEDSDTIADEEPHPFNIKRCTVVINRLRYIEDALKGGYTSFAKISNNQQRPIR